MTDATLSVIIASTPIPLTAADIHGGSYGSTGHVTVRTTRTLLAAQGVNLAGLAMDAPTILPVDVYLTLGSVGPVHVFGGEYLKANWQYRTDQVTIHARDWSGLLVDQKRVLTSILGGNSAPLAPGEQPGAGVSTTNQTLSALVTAIANQFGLTPDIRLASGSGNNPQIGTIFGSSADTILTAVPQSLWGILLRLARDTGNEVYVTPEKHLVFGPPGAGLAPLAFTWKRNPPPPFTLPLLDLSIEHNARRNMTFRVLVLSYDPTAGKTTKGQAYVIGENFSTSTGSTVRAGAWTGAAAASINAAIGTGRSAKKNAIPLYTFHIDGLTQAQASQRAQAIAADIAKRELVVSIQSDILPGLTPGQPARLDGDIEPEFLSHQFYCVSYSHAFRMPQGGSTQGQLHTHATLLDVQPTGAGESVSGGA